MIHLTKPDAAWLVELLDIIDDIHSDHPELFSAEEEETLTVAGQIIRSLV